MQPIEVQWVCKEVLPLMLAHVYPFWVQVPVELQPSTLEQPLELHVE